jgi:hypothetical protein
MGKPSAALRADALGLFERVTARRKQYWVLGRGWRKQLLYPHPVSIALKSPLRRTLDVVRHHMKIIPGEGRRSV